MREIKTTSTISAEFSDVNLLYQNKLIGPSELSKSFTWMYGKAKSSFPLQMLTEGNGATKSLKPKELDGDTQYNWKTFGRPVRTSRCIGLVNTALTKPGLGASTFEVIFEDALFHNLYSLYSPDGQSYVRVEGEGVRLADKRVKYRLQLMTGDRNAYIAADNFLAGKAWSIGGTIIPMSKSDGTTANALTPGMWTNQFSAYRYSFPISGNIANKATIYELDQIDENGTKVGTTNMWIPFQMKLWEIEKREYIETKLWEDEYNRTPEGLILNIDPETGEYLPQGAGVRSQIKAVGNYSTYGDNLTVSFIDKTILSVLGNRNDQIPGEIVWHTGKGGARMINKALLTDAKYNQYFTPLGAEAIKALPSGAYFTQYKTIDGWIVTIKVSDYFDQSVRARQDIENGRTFEGLPFYSYNIVSLDHSMRDDGERNIQFVCEKGREMLSNVYKGMSPIPSSWMPLPTGPSILSTKKDVSSYEVLGTSGIAMTNPTTSFWLEFVK